ncbi:MAG: fasciclin domain-containing protein [Myxococcaceae bacterium]
MRRLLLFALLVAPATWAQAKSNPEPGLARDLVDAAVVSGEFTLFARAMAEAGIVETLRSAGPFTLFAPTDEAFAKLKPKVFEKLLRDPEALRAVLLFHLVPGEQPATALRAMTSGRLPTVAGFPLKVSAKGDGVSVEQAKVTHFDLRASNGVLHGIDTLLSPPK